MIEFSQETLQGAVGSLPVFRRRLHLRAGARTADEGRIGKYFSRFRQDPDAGSQNTRESSGTGPRGYHLLHQVFTNLLTYVLCYLI